MSEKDIKYYRVDKKGREAIESPRRLVNMYCNRAGCQNQDSRENPTYKRCSKCRAVYYCSPDCQKLAWPTHKVVCNLEPDTATFRKIHKRVVTNPLFIQVFQILAIYKHGLHRMNEDELQSLRSKPFTLAVLMQYEPANIKDFLRYFKVPPANDPLMLRTGDNGKPVVAIPQIVASSIIPDRLVKQVDIERWKAGRETERKDSSDNKPPLLAIVRISQWFGGQKTENQSFNNITSFLPIRDNVLEFARRGYEPTLSSILPEPTGDSRMDIANVVGYTNEFVRADRKNHYQLQTKLTITDKRLLAMASIRSREKVLQHLLEALYRLDFKVPDSDAAPHIPAAFKERFMKHPDSPSLDWIDYLRKKVLRERVYLQAAEEHGYDPDTLLRDVVAGTQMVELEVPEVTESVLRMAFD